MLSLRMPKAGPSVWTTILGVCVLLGVVLTGLFVAVSLSRCTNVQANVFVWPLRVRCHEPTVAALAVVDDVLMRDGLAEQLSPESLHALEDVARHIGAEDVVCALQRLIEGYSIPPGMPPPAVYLARATRAQQFLTDNSIEVIR
jgi:hypothetical protein